MIVRQLTGMALVVAAAIVTAAAVADARDGATRVSPSPSDDVASGLVLLPDGRVVVAGTGGQDVQLSGTFAAARYNGTGALDGRFGSGGKTSAAPPGPGTAVALARQPDGGLVLAGVIGGGDQDFVVARLTADGHLDKTFGRSGFVRTDLRPGQRDLDVANAVVAQRDGRIVVAGQTSGRAGRMFALVRYRRGGSLDPSFGAGGRVVTPFVRGSDAFGLDLTLQRDGKIIVVGGMTETTSEFVLARYRGDGRLDPTFGRGGKVVTDFRRTDFGWASAVAVQPDGRIIVAGLAYPRDVGDGDFGDFVTARYTRRGVLDRTFGVGGVKHEDFGPAEGARAVVVAADGRIVVAGWSERTINGPDPRFALVRYTRAGRLDPSFGAEGIVVAELGAGVAASIAAIRATPDGGLLAAGGARAGGASDFALARFTASGALDASFGAGGVVFTDFGGG